MKIVMTKVIWALLIVLIVSLSSACSLLLKRDTAVDQVYQLSPEARKVNPSIDANIYIPQVTINPALNNRRIMLLSTTNNRLDFIANSRWPDNLGVYLQAIMIDGLSASGAFKSVSERILGRKNNYRLLLRVADFQAELQTANQLELQSHQRVNVIVVIEATLSKGLEQRLLGQQRYIVRKQNVDARTSRIVSAFGQALSEVLNSLVIDIRKAI